jgi:hypothetical protein
VIGIWGDGTAVDGIHAAACVAAIGAWVTAIGAMCVAETTPLDGDDMTARGRVDAGPELVPVVE